MNWSFISGVVIVAYAVWATFSNVFGVQIPIWNTWAALFILAGSAGLAMISLGWPGTVQAVKYLVTGIWNQHHWQDRDVVEKMTKMAQAYRDYNFEEWDQLTLDEYTQSCKEVLKDGVVDSQTRKNIFQTKLQTVQDQTTRHALQLRHLAQYPISVGLINLVIACFALSWMSLHDANREVVASTLSFGFHSVLYGLFVSHLWIYPVARRVYEQAKVKSFYHQMIAHALNMIGAGAHPVQVKEELNAYIEKNVVHTAKGREAA